MHKVDQIVIGRPVGGGGDASGEHAMEAGDVAMIPAGHPHWHGALEEYAFSHITISR
ncbi:hypothetical protein [Mesorhizobium sp. A623]